MTARKSPEQQKHQAIRLSVVTVFWNSADDLEPWFAAMQECCNQSEFEIEVIAVDNASKDGTADTIAKEYPWAKLIRNKENRGFSPGCNDGLKKATGEYVLLLNPDCEARPGALSHMLRFLSKNRKVGAVGCTLLHGDGLPQHSHHHEPGILSYWGTHSLLSPLLARLYKLTFGFTSSEKPRDVDWLMGACIMTRREVLDDVGLLDPVFFMYSEDSDWCRRARNAGYRVVYDPRTWIVHHQGTTARRRAEFTFRRLYKSMLLYSNKHHGFISRVGLRKVVCLDMILRAPIYMIMGERKRLASIQQVIAAFVTGNPDRIDTNI